MNALSVLLWTGCLWVLIEWKLTGNPKLWLLFGLLAGLGFQNKQTIVVMFLCLGVGLLLTKDRKCLRSGWLWGGAALAFLIAAPNLWWQFQHDWISMEFYRNAALEKMLPVPPSEVLFLQLLFINLGGAPVWVAGVFYFLLNRQGKRFRPIALAYVLLLAVNMIGGQGRPDRLAPIYPVLFAAGAVFWESLSRSAGKQWLRWALPIVVLAPAILLLPLVTPLTPPAQLAGHAQWLGVVPQFESGPGKKAALPQWMADRLGWELLAEDVEIVVDSLSPEERKQAAILAPSYGQAGAVELLGRDLPPVRGGQNSYFLWAKGLSWPQVLISIGYGPESLGSFYDTVEQVRIHDCDYCMPWRDNTPIYIARKPGPVDYDRVWDRFKNLQ